MKVQAAYGMAPPIPIDPKKWYIIDTFRLTYKGKAKMIKKKFDNVHQIKMCLEKFLNSNLRYDWIRGDEAIELELKIMRFGPEINEYLEKYNYENYMVTYQDKKSYRTKFRRQKRTKTGELSKKWG